jgi:uncharacterized membrane protein YbhN (UPF0104 family)
MKKKIRLLISLAIVSIFVFYFFYNIEDFKLLLDINPAPLFVVGGATLGSIIANGLAVKFLVEPFKIELTANESIKVSAVSTVGNFFAPAGGGMGVRAVYLKKKHLLPYSSYIPVLAANYVYVFIVSSAIGIIALTFADYRNPQFYFVLASLAMLLVVNLVILFASRSQANYGNFSSANNDEGVISKPTYYFRLMILGLRKISKTKHLTRKVLFVNICNLSLSVLSTFVLTRVLSVNVDFYGVVLLSVLGSLSLFINITPANLGVKEAVFIFISTSIGISVNEALTIALIDRAILFVVLSILWVHIFKLKNFDN